MCQPTSSPPLHASPHINLAARHLLCWGHPAHSIWMHVSTGHCCRCAWISNLSQRNALVIKAPLPSWCSQLEDIIFYFIIFLLTELLQMVNMVNVSYLLEFDCWWIFRELDTDGQTDTVLCKSQGIGAAIYQNMYKHKLKNRRQKTDSL